MVLVVIEAHVAPTPERPLFATTWDRLDFPKGRVSGRRWSRVFQGRDDPASLLFLAHWDSREGFERAYDRRQPHPAEALLARPATPRFFQSLVAFERVMVPVVARSVLLIEGSPMAMPPLRAYLLDLFETHRESLPGLVTCIVGEETASTATLLLVTGWQTLAGLDAVRGMMAAQFTTRIADAGATSHSFLGVPIGGAV
jgi:hypothetical protein